MNLSSVLPLAFALQGFAMFFDEFYFHRKRGLPLWERIGHPLDTITVLICYIFVLVFPPIDSYLPIFAGLCFFSCLFVTKDEFVHAEKCSATEQWLHSILFILHPISFGVLGWLWLQTSVTSSSNPLFWPIIQFQVLLISCFLIYQIVYWNLVWKQR